MRRIAVMSVLALFLPQAEKYAHMNPELVQAVSPHGANAEAYREAQKIGGRSYHIADTGSMKPTLFGNEYLTMQKGKYEDLKEGQIVMYMPKWAVENVRAGHPLNLKADNSQVKVEKVLPGRRIQYSANGETKIAPMDDFYSLVTHRIVLKDKGGWIASGDANGRSESWERITPENYFGTVVKIYTHPGSERHKKKK